MFPVRLTVMLLPNFAANGAAMLESHVAGADVEEYITVLVSRENRHETSDNRFGVARRHSPNV